MRPDATDGKAIQGNIPIALIAGAERVSRKDVWNSAIAIDHTYTPPEFRGNNIAFKLIERSVADARRDGVKIKPECSYAVVQFRRHPDWADLLA